MKRSFSHVLRSKMNTVQSCALHLQPYTCYMSSITVTSPLVTTPALYTTCAVISNISKKLPRFPSITYLGLQTSKVWENQFFDHGHTFGIFLNAIGVSPQKCSFFRAVVSNKYRQIKILMANYCLASKPFPNCNRERFLSNKRFLGKIILLF